MRSTRQWLCLAFMLILTGCNSSQPTDQENETTGDLPALSIIADSEQSLALFQMEEKNIKEKFGVRLEYHYPDRLNDNLEDFLFASNQTYDIYMIFPAKIPEYVERDMLLPLDSYIEKTKDIDDVLPVYRNLYMKFDNHDYGMVYDGDTHLLFYRKDVFEKYNSEYKALYGRNLEPPSTWKEYDQIAQFLTRDQDDDGEIDLYGTAIFGGDAKRYIWFAERFASMGGKYFDEEMNPLIQEELGIKALQDLINLNDSGATPPNSMYDWIDLNNTFLHGDLAMVVQWSDTSRFSFDHQTWDSQIENKVGWTLVPADNPENPRGGVWIGRVLGISKQSAHPEKAWEIISYITSKEISKNALISKETINDPFRYSHFTAIEKGAFPTVEMNEDFLNTVKSSLHNPNADLMIPGGWEYMQALDQNIHKALIHNLTAEEALQQTAVEWNEITARYNANLQAVHYKQWLNLLEEVGKNEME
ncbi:ABC transporter substrate-binding protein [Bacillus tuaregi]|uniref:ABC transporter substrate-binding protein n=1 Tax=Bacillus tuaregi TaxID=1816695 RepID=UPI000ABCE5B0|nr:sugar ABC transporter substrate-binding protein [Bacillus tuaregi]